MSLVATITPDDSCTTIFYDRVRASSDVHPYCHASITSVVITTAAEPQRGTCMSLRHMRDVWKLMPDLTRIHVGSRVAITVVDIRVVARDCPHLDALVIENPRVGFDVIKAVPRELPRLKQLDITAATVSMATAVDAAQHMPHLQTLSLCGTPRLHLNTRFTLAGIKPVTTLTTLHLRDCWIDDTDAAVIVRLFPNLEELVLTGASLTANGMSTLMDELPNLQKLDL